jgi:hypothetical protein
MPHRESILHEIIYGTLLHLKYSNEWSNTPTNTATLKEGLIFHSTEKDQQIRMNIKEYSLHSKGDME